jgi:hypothetical protein
MTQCAEEDIRTTQKLEPPMVRSDHQIDYCVWQWKEAVDESAPSSLSGWECDRNEDPRGRTD